MPHDVTERFARDLQKLSRPVLRQRLRNRPVDVDPKCRPVRARGIDDAADITREVDVDLGPRYEPAKLLNDEVEARYGLRDTLPGFPRLFNDHGAAMFQSESDGIDRLD